MKKIIGSIIVTAAFILMCFIPARETLGGAGEIFQPEIDKAVNQTIEAWTVEKDRDLKTALERLTLNETYLMAVGGSGKDRSYLALVPKSLGHNFNAVAAYLFLIRKEREGVSLWPLSFFEGKRFQFEQKGAR